MNSDFGERIKFLRKQKNLTQTELADILKVTKTMVSAYETGVRKPSYENLMELVLFFDVSMDWMFGESENYRTKVLNDFNFLDNPQLEIVYNLIAEFKRVNMELRGKDNCNRQR